MELTVEQALQQGVAAHKEGKLQDAERLYRATAKNGDRPRLILQFLTPKLIHPYEGIGISFFIESPFV